MGALGAWNGGMQTEDRIQGPGVREGPAAGAFGTTLRQPLLSPSGSKIVPGASLLATRTCDQKP